MDSHGTTNTQNSIKQNGLKFNFGKVKSEKYGEATISGHLLFMTHEEIPPVNVKAVQEKACVWLRQMGLEKYQDKLLGLSSVADAIARIAVDVDPEKLELYFKVTVFSVCFDDIMPEISQLYKNNPTEHQKDIMDLIENLIMIINNRGDENMTQSAISKLNPIFKMACRSLSYACQCSFEHMSENDYNHFAKEISEFIKVHKWFLEYRNVPFTKREYLFLRLPDVLLSLAIFLSCFAKNIRIPDVVRKHCVFQRYYRNILLYTAITNDIFSLPKEIAADEKFNMVLIYCQKYSLQKSIHKTMKTANELVIDLQKDKFRLLSYFPTNDGLKNFIKVSEQVSMGLAYWVIGTARYGEKNTEIQVMEYSCDYNNWVDEMRTINEGNIDETHLSIESDNTEIPSLFL